MSLIINLIIQTLSVYLSAMIVPGIQLRDIYTALIVAIVFGVLNVFVKPVLQVLTFPLTVLTLGLFLIVINVFVIYLVDYLVPGFTVNGAFNALLFGILLSLIQSFLSKLV
jgi:putative membrane protein